MKILHVITSLLAGGAEKLMVDLLPRFKAMGLDVELAVFNAVDTPFMRALADSDVSVHRFAPEGCNVYSPQCLLKLRRLIRHGGFDIVHTHNTAPQLFAAICGANRLVTTEHNTDNRRRHLPLLKTADRWMYSRYDAVICISDGTADNLASHLGEAIRSKVTVIPNGVDISVFQGEIKPIATDAPVVLTMVAGFRPQKDQDTLLRALALLPERFRVRLVGDGVRRHILETLADDLGVAARVEFAGMRDDIPAQLQASDIIVLSSHYEGLSLASIEAMASGRPLVASDVPGLREVVAGHGLLFAEGDAQSLAVQVTSLASDPNLYVSTAAACQRQAARFDISLAASAYAQLYKRLQP